MKQDSWLYSDSFLKRAFAYWGYMTVANLIVMIPFTILWIVLASVFFASYGTRMPGTQNNSVQYDQMPGFDSLPPEIQEQIRVQLEQEMQAQ